MPNGSALRFGWFERLERPNDSNPSPVQCPAMIDPSLLVRRPSRIAGWGVYTRAPITKNTRIIDYAGELISHRESARRERRHLARGHVWCFTVNRRHVRDASVGGNLARFINHACRPNCYSRVTGHTIWICAARNIAAGEELTYDYRTDGKAVISCRCRPGCRTQL
jgi:SET domain-containing protein